MAVKKCHWAFLLTLYGYMTIVILVECADPIVLKLNSSTNGLLDVRYEGKWGGICSFGGGKPQFDDNAANVACRQMGFRTGTKHSFIVDVFKLKLDMELYNVTCKGNEIGLSRCLIQPYTSATCNFAIKVDCTDDPALDGLFNATFRDSDTKAHEGILQVTKDGTKGDVCFVDITSANAVAKVVCKQMGYSGYHPSTSVNSSSSTSFYDASCQGTEQTLAACTLSTAKTCSSGKVVNVQCKLDNATQDHFDVRLSSPTNSLSQGTVEVYQYGRWGVVCDTDWDENDAEVVCRELGYKSAKSNETGAKFGQGSGVVFWNKMQCNGNEPSIANCTKEVALGTKTCDSANAAGVVCDGAEKFATINICSNGSKVLEAGVTMIQSEAQPKPFSYSQGQTCFLHLTSPTNFTVYIYKKMFEENHVEHLSFISAGRKETLYGDDSRQGPFDFSSGSLTIEFNADNATGSGVINIMVSVAAPPPTPKAVTTTTNGTNGNYFTTATGKSEEIRDDGGTTNAVIIGVACAVVGGLVLIAIVVILFLIKKKKIKCKQRSAKKRKSSVGSYENNVDVQEHTSFTPDLFAANPRGNGVIPGNGVDKEPETGETEQKTKVTRPASGSGIKVEIPRASTGLNTYELEKFPKGGVQMDYATSPYELEGAPSNQACSPYELESPTLGAEEPVTKGVGPQHFTVSGPGNQEYAMVNKPRMGIAPLLSPKGTVGNQEYAMVNKPPVAPKYTVGGQENAEVNKPKNDTGGVPPSGPTVPPKLSELGPTVPPKNLDGPGSQYVPGGNLVKDQPTEPPVTGVPEYNPYQVVEEESNPPFNKPNTFMPGISAAYADVELGAPGEASKIQDQPKQKEPMTNEKKKKHGKDKKKPEKEKKKKLGKDKKKSKENLAEDAAHAPVGNDTCAVPMRDDFDMPPECEYAEVGARRGVGHMNPAFQPEQNNSETYDHLDFKGRKTAPQNPGGEATYDTVHRDKL